MASSCVKANCDPVVLDAICKDLDRVDAPGAAVGVALHGRPVYRKAFGLAHCEFSQQLTPSMRMRIGSVSKQFTSLAYLLLCEDGLARIDDRVGRWLPEIGSVSRNVTMRQLMGHLSGLRDSYDLACLASGEQTVLSAADLFTFYQGFQDLNHSPGTRWTYNNGGYLLLSLVIERIADQPLEDVLRTRIFEPVGMPGTLLRHDDREFVPNSATLHLYRPGGKFEKVINGTVCSGAGGIASTIDDMLCWMAHMATPQIGSAATWSALQTPQMLANGTSTNYALGLIRHEHRGIDTLWHSGGVLGGNAQMLKAPELGLDIVIITNRDDVSSVALANKVLDACLPDRETSVNEVGLARLHGLFRSQSTGRHLQLFEKDGEQVMALDGAEQPLVMGQDGALRPPLHRAYLKLLLAPDRIDPVSSIQLEEYGVADRFAAISQDLEPPEVGSGCYHCPSVGLEASIRGSEMRIASPFGSARFELHPLGEDSWRASSKGPVAMTAILTRSNAGIEIATGRNRALTFGRMEPEA